MKKKIIELNLTYTIPALVKYQEYVIKNLPAELPKEILGFQEDILTVLKAVRQIEIVDMDAN